MKSTTKKLQDWAINKIKTEFAEDVALLIAVHGHSVNNDEHGECFDYFIPATERGYELSQTFILEGIGYDLYPRSWERTEATALLEDEATMCLADADIVYSRSKEEEKRFLDIQKKLKENLANKEYMYCKGLEQLETAMNLFSTMVFHDKMYQVRMAVGYISKYLSKTIANLNGTYIDNYEKEVILAMRNIPNKFIDYSEAIFVAKTTDELKKLAYNMINDVRKYAASQTPSDSKRDKEINFFSLAGWYQELSLTFRRLQYYCSIKDKKNVYMAACYLQNELSIEQEEFGLCEMDLMGYYNSDNLQEIKEQAIQLEKYLVSVIEKQGVVINKYETVDEFLEKN